MGGTLRELGYQETKGAPGVFWNPNTGVELVLHVDDFLVVGEEQALQKIEREIASCLRTQGDNHRKRAKQTERKALI